MPSAIPIAVKQVSVPPEAIPLGRVKPLPEIVVSTTLLVLLNQIEQGRVKEETEMTRPMAALQSIAGLAD